MFKEKPGHHWVNDAVYDADTDSDVDAARASDQGTVQFLSNVDEFFKMWNGDMWIADCCIHYCSGKTCCSSRADTVQKMIATAERVLFKSNVPTIAANKWTKLAPVLDWILVSQLVHKVLFSSFTRLGIKSEVPEDSFFRPRGCVKCSV